MKNLWKNREYRIKMVDAHKGKGTTHGHASRSGESRFYKVYENMKYRCNNKKHKAYKNYGSRGIRVEWKKFDDFLKDMYASYLIHVSNHGEKNTSIDRIDNDGNYSNKNCRWATRSIQQFNKSNNRLITFKGKTKAINRWAKELKIGNDVIRYRIKAGWPLEKVFSKENHNYAASKGVELNQEKK